MTYPSSNYKTIRAEIKLAYKLLTEQHTTFKRKGLISHGDADYRKVRIAHIAYSMFKGNTFEQIESKWREPDSSTNHYIKAQALKLYDSYMKRIIVAEDANEVVCDRP